MASRRALMLLIGGIGQFGGIERVNELVTRVWGEFCRDHDLELIVVSRNDRGAEKIDLTGLGRASFVGCGGSKARFMSSALLWAARRRPATIYVGHINFAVIAMILRYARFVGSYVVQLHGFEVWGRLPLLRRAGLRSAHRILSVSGYTAAAAVDQSGANASKVRVVAPALLPRWTAMDTGLDLSEVSQIPTLLTIARLSREESKKVGDVITVLGRLAQKGLDFHYVVVGGGSGKGELEALCSSVGLDDKITFTGAVSDRDTHRLLASCDIFVMPSTQEGFGLVFLEAMWYGKPVVAAAAGGAPEVVVDGQTGILVLPHDLDALAVALETLLRDAKLRETFGRAGSERVRSVFSVERFRAAMFEELDGLLGAEG